jgi:hypothetical protein
MYKLRDGCEPPVHGKVEDKDPMHPRFSEYMRYRAAMSAQLVRCPSFKDWLRQDEEIFWAYEA